MGFIKEFKEFAMRGNVADLAVGVIIGASFGKIVTSAVDDMVMPPIGFLLGGIDFADKKLLLKPADEVHKIPEIAVRYGAFINNVIQFLITAFCVFMLVKLINAMKRKEDILPADPSAPSQEINILTDIRDILKNQRNN